MPEVLSSVYFPPTELAEDKAEKSITARDFRTLPSSCSPEHIQLMEKNGLLLLQRHFNLGSEWGRIRIPQEWLSKSNPKGQGNFDLYKRLKGYASTEPELELGVITAVRMVLLTFCTPTKSGKKAAKHLAPTTIMNCLSVRWLNYIKFALLQPVNENGRLLDRISTYKYKSRDEEEMRRFQNLHARGLWRDNFFSPSVETISESSNRGERETERTQPTNDPYLPLPDALVHEAGRCSAWIINTFAPMLLTSYEKIVSMINDYRAKFGENYNYTRMLADYLYNYQWRDADGQPFPGFPFQIDIKFGKSAVIWPPSKMQDLQQFLMMVQMANFFVVALSAGPRAGEILSFTTECLIESRDGTALANGKTYKLVDTFEGVMRDWPMPYLAVQALHYQSRLSAAISDQFASEFEPGGVPLWRLFHAGGAGGALGSGYNVYVRLYVRRLRLHKLMDRQALTHHRFRKTIARLVALAQIHAPKILMDIFGHKSIEMTMHYILSDPSILSEMRAVRKELILVMAKKSIKNAASNDGPAAQHIIKAVHEIRYRTSNEYGVENEDDLAMMLTGQGLYWMQPRPGVICTKLVDQVGPCTKGSSRPNPARCQNDCSFRLEEADNRQQVDNAIADIVKKIQRAWAHQDEMLAQVWSGQLVANLRRFNDLSMKWSEHPVVITALSRNYGKALNVPS